MFHTKHCVKQSVKHFLGLNIKKWLNHAENYFLELSFRLVKPKILIVELFLVFKMFHVKHFEMFHTKHCVKQSVKH